MSTSHCDCTEKNGGIRLCVNLRKPNTSVIVDSHPLPCPDELFHRLSGAKIFSKLDLSSAYHQLDLAEESRDLTAFVTHEGLFRFTRVCIGLASAAPAFQKLMDCILKGTQGTIVYLDDVLIFGATNKEHDVRLREVLTRLQEAGLKLNKDKCIFSVPQLQFLGHEITPRK